MLAQLERCGRPLQEKRDIHISAKEENEEKEAVREKEKAELKEERERETQKDKYIYIHIYIYIYFRLFADSVNLLYDEDNIMIKEWIKIPTKYCTEMISLLMFRLGEIANLLLDPTRFRVIFIGETHWFECDFLIVSLIIYTDCFNGQYKYKGRVSRLEISSEVAPNDAREIREGRLQNAPRTTLDNATTKIAASSTRGFFGTGVSRISRAIRPR